MGSGTYSAGTQTINPHLATGSGSLVAVPANVVTFLPESGTVTISGRVNISSLNGSTTSHILFQGIHFADFVQIGEGDDIHFTDGQHRALIQAVGAHWFSLERNDIGAHSDADCIELYPYGDTVGRTPQDVLLTGNAIHDCTSINSGDHPDALAVDSANRITITKNHWYRNCGIDYRGADSAITGAALMENNIFGAPVTTTSVAACAVGTFFTAYISGPYLVRFNTFEGSLQPPNAGQNAGQVWNGNIDIGDPNNGNCPNGSGQSSQYNIWLSSSPTTCGVGATNAQRTLSQLNSMFVNINPNNSTGSNLHLVSGAFASNYVPVSISAPATDFDGTSRPQGSQNDAGALQAAVAAGNNYFVSPGGSGTACTLNAPCSVAQGFSNYPNSTSGTIHFLNGTYPPITVTKGGASTSQRLVLQCDAGVSSAITALGKCIVTGTSASFSVTAGNNIDITGFDMGGNDNMNVCFVSVVAQSSTPSPVANSVHVIGNICHDAGALIWNDAHTAQGCPEAGALLFGNHSAPITDQWAIRNIVIRYGQYAAHNPACHTAQGITGHGNPFLVYDNIVLAIPVGGITMHDSCHFAVSNNIIGNVSDAIILGSVDGTCGTYGNNLVNNNYMFSIFGTSGKIFSVSNVAKCDATHRNGYHNNQSDGTTPADFAPSAPYSCEDVSPATLGHQAASAYFVNPSTTGGAPGTFVADFNLLPGSIGIGAGSVACVAGGANPCTPTTDFVGATFGPLNVGAYASSGGGGGTPILSASPPSLAFAAVTAGSCSVSPLVSTISNSGTASLTITDKNFTGTNLGDFIFGGSGTCGGVPIALSPGSSCTQSVKFCPTAAGARSANLAFSNTTATNPFNLGLSGTGASPTVSLSPTSLNFGSQQLGSASAIQTVTLSNTGTGTLTFTFIALTGTDLSQFSQTNTCGATLGAGASCSFSVTFNPSSLGAKTAAITITDNATGSPHSVPLTGTGTGTPMPQFAPTSLTFTNQLVGTTSAPQPVTLTNTGTAPLTINSITTSGDFGQTNNCPSPLAVSTSCTINVTFSPTVPGARSGSLVAVSNGTGSPTTAALSGTGTQGAISLAPTSLTFAGQNTGTTSASQTIAITNTGTATVTLSSVAKGGTNPGDFGLVNGCGATLAAGISCNATLTFTPTATGARSALLVVTDSAPGSPHQAALNGTGLAPVVSLAPASIPFGNQITGTISSAQNLTLSNTGTGTLTIASIALTGTNANQFTQSGTCGATLAAGANCTIAIRFAPTSNGAKTAALTVTDNAAGSPHSSALTGTGISGAPVVSLTPSTMTFPSTLLGVTSAGQTAMLTNTGTAALTLTSIGVTGDYSQTNNCVSPIAVAASCQIVARFTPTVVGMRTGTLSVIDNASGSPHTIALSGTGASSGGGGSGIAVISPSSLTFSSQVTGTSSAPQVITLSNTDTATMVVNSITFSGGNPTDYSQTNNCVPSLGAGASCTVNVTFKPIAVGSRPATVVFTDSAPTSPQSIPVSGTGISPFPIVQLTPTSLNFGSIQQASTTANQTVTVKNVGTAILNIASITKMGTNAADYGLTNGCGATLAINATCLLTINFTPSGLGTRSASISIASDDPTSPSIVPLTGTGTAAPAPKVSLTTTSLTFPLTTVGATSATQTVTVTNIGDAILTLSSIALGPPNATDYILSSACGATLAAGANCVLTLSFQPVAAGTRISNVILTDNASDSPQSVALSGTAFVGAPTADLSVSTLVYLAQVILTTSSVQTIALTNNGTAALAITSITASSDLAPASSEYAQTNNCGTSLPAGGSCTVNVTFTPQAVGARTGKVTFVDNAAGSPQVVTLMGSGVNPPPPPGNSAIGIGGRASMGGKIGTGVH